MNPRAAINSSNALRQKDRFWTRERVDLLRFEWTNNTFVGEIAAHLGCTRDMVIGKAKRLGLPRRKGWTHFSQRRRYGLSRVSPREAYREVPPWVRI